ncbi:MAG: hypothetical protein IKJ65_00895 [Clostridia bacterium]|nr:hypothetical protein [Clostridia bacterium]
MPNTKITLQKWKDHYSYAKKVYIVGALLAAGLASLIFAVTRYVPPNERAVIIQMVDTYADPAKMNADIPELLAAGQEYDTSLEEVSFLTIAYTGDDDYEGSQVYTVQVYAGDNDIYFQNDILTQRMINEGYALALEYLEGFDAFSEKYSDYIIWEAIEEDDEEKDEDEEQTAEPEEHAYSVDISALLGINQRGAYDVRGKYALIAINSENANTCFKVLSEMFDRFIPAEEIQ